MRGSRCGSPRRLPRPRGDGPWDEWILGDAKGAPPPTRGWTLRHRCGDGDRDGSPAHAGMDPAHRPPVGWSAVAPPPTRGWTPNILPERRIHYGSPAHAGMDPCWYRSMSTPSWLPRPRGDGPDIRGLDGFIPLAPPPTRGWTQGQDLSRRSTRGSPAHAGMDPSYEQHPFLHRRLPRPRGDGPGPRPSSRPRSRAPPPTRGWTVGIVYLTVDSSGSPAHAGMDPTPFGIGGDSVWLPRPRGDGPGRPSWSLCLTGAPPPTRGWTRTASAPGSPARGSPAHAGMDPLRRCP